MALPKTPQNMNMSDLLYVKQFDNIKYHISMKNNSHELSFAVPGLQAIDWKYPKNFTINLCNCPLTMKLHYTSVGIPPAREVWRKYLLFSAEALIYVQMFFCVSCEWETKHQGEKIKLTLKRGMNFDFYQSISHSWCFTAVYIWWNNSSNGSERQLM